MEPLERKTIGLDALELKFDAEGEGPLFSGYASVFNGVDAYGDTIVPGAYTKTIKKRQRPILMRWNHFGPVIGKWKEAREDEKGLFVVGELTPGHSVAGDVYASMRHGAVTGLSIGYRPIKFTETGDGTRTLKEIELVEISIVEMPADLGAVVGAIKSALEEAEDLKAIERLLRDAAGFSRADATALVSRIKSLARSECEAEMMTSKTFATQLSTISQNLFKGD